jgi:hypothetical protein
MSTDNLKKFVQQTLGCGCPEEVFQHIDCQTDIIYNQITVKNRINIGNRLLVYLAEIDTPASLAALLPSLYAAGRKDRDASGFNRLRIVLAAEKTDEVKLAAEHLFSQINTDEKIHLHILSKQSIPHFSQ